jgi:hypothetical protein
MKPYIVIALVWIVAAYCFYNGWYGFRFPEKYMANPWTRPRGVTNDNVAGLAAVIILVGCLFFGFGLIAIHAILTEPSGPLPPLP